MDPHDRNPNAFAISLAQAVEYTATRVKPTKPGTASNFFAEVPAMRNPQPSTAPLAQVLDATVFESSYILHPRQSQHLSINDQEMYLKHLSRSLDIKRVPEYDFYTAISAPGTLIRRPTTPTHPAPMSKRLFNSLDIRTQLTLYRQECAAQLLEQMEEDGWTDCERAMVHTDAITRDFGPDCFDNLSNADIDKLLGKQDTTEAMEPIPNPSISHISEEKVGTQDTETSNDHQVGMPATPSKIIRYTGQDEVEEAESDHEQEVDAETRARVIKQIKRDRNKRVALFLSDYILEGRRVLLMNV